MVIYSFRRLICSEITQCAQKTTSIFLFYLTPCPELPEDIKGSLLLLVCFVAPVGVSWFIDHQSVGRFSVCHLRCHLSFIRTGNTGKGVGGGNHVATGTKRGRPAFHRFWSLDKQSLGPGRCPLHTMMQTKIGRDSLEIWLTPVPGDADAPPAYCGF